MSGNVLLNEQNMSKCIEAKFPKVVTTNNIITRFDNTSPWLFTADVVSKNSICTGAMSVNTLDHEVLSFLMEL